MWSQLRRSVLARRFDPRSAAVSAGSARCATQPHLGELFRHKAPSGRGLQGEVGVETLEGYEEFSDRLPDSRHDAASLDLASLGIQPFVRDLLPMHVECTYNPHWDLLDSSARTLGP